MNFEKLITDIEQTHGILQKNAVSSVNINLSLRNWLIGCYIVEFEQNGSDRAVYGQRLLERLAQQLKHIKGLTASELSRFRTFYQIYPHFFGTVSQELKHRFDFEEVKILGTLSQESVSVAISPKNSVPAVKPEKLLRNLSYSHFVELIKMTDPLKRAFYEIESIKGIWGVRTLKRQIDTLLYERTGMSKNKTKMIEIANQNTENEAISDFIRQPYIFEFLGLKEKDVVSETELEAALLQHIQDFLLEMGEGFCFEARQKRIPFETTYGVIDLVFYHRILKCHVLVELKVNKVDYSAITQLNTYIGYYRKNVMRADDKPTIGILLCTAKDNLMVEFALAGLDEKIFVSEYLLYIPNKETFEKFIKSEIQKF